MAGKGTDSGGGKSDLGEALTIGFGTPPKIQFSRGGIDGERSVGSMGKAAKQLLPAFLRDRNLINLPAKLLQRRARWCPSV